MAAAVKRFSDYIKGETLTVILSEEALGPGKAIANDSFDGEDLDIALEKAR